MSNVYGASGIHGEYSIINDLVFMISIDKDYKYFLINFSELQRDVFPIFKLLNSTEAAYDN